jgi:transglutaminase-like putative cysteine protease
MHRHYSDGTLEKQDLLQETFGKQIAWHDVYKQDRKIGYAMTTVEKAGKKIIIRQDRIVRAVSRKTRETTNVVKKLRCLTDENYIIQSFEYISELEGLSRVAVQGEVHEGKIIAFLESGEKRKKVVIPLNSREFYIPLTLIPAFTREIPYPGKSHTIQMLNFGTMMLSDVRVVLEEILPVKVGRNIQSLYKFRIGDLLIWSNENGAIIKEHLGTITLYSQTQDRAENIEEKPIFDFTSLPFFRSNISISDPETVSQLRVRIHGYQLSTKEYRRSPVTLDGSTVIVRKQDKDKLRRDSYTLPFSEGNLQEYLSPDTWVRSDYQRLQKTGKIYANTYNNDAFLFAQYLTGYVYNIIKTWPVFALSDGEDVLKTLSGDYLERTVLFASYARAAGLPTRLVGGLVYVDGYFYFHTWPEVWINGWIPADPTFYQFPADATHIPLKRGTLEDVVSIVDYLDAMKIEVLEAL